MLAYDDRPVCFCGYDGKKLVYIITSDMASVCASCLMCLTFSNHDQNQREVLAFKQQMECACCTQFGSTMGPEQNGRKHTTNLLPVASMQVLCVTEVRGILTKLKREHTSEIIPEVLMLRLPMPCPPRTWSSMAAFCYALCGTSAILRYAMSLNDAGIQERIKTCACYIIPAKCPARIVRCLSARRLKGSWRRCYVASTFNRTMADQSFSPIARHDLELFLNTLFLHWNRCSSAR